jgi:hypothetical protein
MVVVEEVKVVVAHNERATLRVRDVFLKIDDRITGVIDWSEAARGDALYDLAVLTLGHEEHRDDVLAGYGTDVDLDVIRGWWSWRSLAARARRPRAVTWGRGWTCRGHRSPRRRSCRGSRPVHAIANVVCDTGRGHPDLPRSEWACWRPRAFGHRSPAICGGTFAAKWGFRTHVKVVRSREDLHSRSSLDVFR